MSNLRRSILIALGLVFLATIAGLFLTRDALLRIRAERAHARQSDQTIVDQEPARQANSLAAQASTSEEQLYALDAQRLAEHTVDLAFNAVLQAEAVRAENLTGQAAALDQRMDALTAKVKADKTTLAAATAKADVMTKAGDVNADDAVQEVELQQAQLELDQDDLADVQQELAMAGGDRSNKIDKERSAYETLKQQGAQIAAQGGSREQQLQARIVTLHGRISLWSALRSEAAQLKSAAADARARSQNLAREHAALAAQPPPPTAPAATHAQTIARLHRLADRRVAMATLDRRVEDQQALAKVYDNWRLEVERESQAVLNLILGALIYVFLVLLVVFVIDAAIRHYFDDPKHDRRRLRNVRVVLLSATYVVGTIVALFIIFGVPQQTPTVLGLVGAGITVVMRDFIIAFLGWFVLMGRNGIRVGDWVEINDISGEVVEIGLLRTTLLEMGNWAETGLPTGRRVTLMNGFAIEGHYFNFTTTGQWLLDEVKITIPADGKQNEKIQQIEQIVRETTSKDADIAVQEWRRATRSLTQKPLTAAPGIELRPAGSDIEVVVRYITRANERYGMRSQLYSRILKILQGDGVPNPNLLEPTQPVPS
jgi:small-conductance mechanosensitive channel